MTAQQVIAPPCAPPVPPGDVTPTSGVIHVNTRHTSGFTVIGNHLAQHDALSLLAIGLAVHIESLPDCRPRSRPRRTSSRNARHRRP